MQNVLENCQCRLTSVNLLQWNSSIPKLNKQALGCLCLSIRNSVTLRLRNIVWYFIYIQFLKFRSLLLLNCCCSFMDVLRRNQACCSPKTRGLQESVKRYFCQCSLFQLLIFVRVKVSSGLPLDLQPLKAAECTCTLSSLSRVGCSAV